MTGPHVRQCELVFDGHRYPVNNWYTAPTIKKMLAAHEGGLSHGYVFEQDQSTFA